MGEEVTHLCGFSALGELSARSPEVIRHAPEPETRTQRNRHPEELHERPLPAGLVAGGLAPQHADRHPRSSGWNCRQQRIAREGHIARQSRTSPGMLGGPYFVSRPIELPMTDIRGKRQVKVMRSSLSLSANFACRRPAAVETATPDKATTANPTMNNVASTRLRNARPKARSSNRTILPRKISLLQAATDP